MMATVSVSFFKFTTFCNCLSHILFLCLSISLLQKQQRTYFDRWRETANHLSSNAIIDSFDAGSKGLGVEVTDRTNSVDSVKDVLGVFTSSPKGSDKSVGPINDVLGMFDPLEAQEQGEDGDPSSSLSNNNNLDDENNNLDEVVDELNKSSSMVEDASSSSSSSSKKKKKPIVALPEVSGRSSSTREKPSPRESRFMSLDDVPRSSGN
jgi:hypothetical protein